MGCSVAPRLHKSSGDFLYARNTEIMGNPRVNNDSNDPKKVASFSGELTADTRTVMTNKFFASFFEVKGPHIYFWTGAPLRINPALDEKGDSPYQSQFASDAAVHPYWLRQWCTSAFLNFKLQKREEDCSKRNIGRVGISEVWRIRYIAGALHVYGPAAGLLLNMTPIVWVMAWHCYIGHYKTYCLTDDMRGQEIQPVRWPLFCHRRANAVEQLRQPDITVRTV